MALINVNKNTPMPCLVILVQLHLMKLDIFFFTKKPHELFLFQGVITLLMLATDNVYQLIEYTAFVESFFTAVSVAGLLFLRYLDP